MAEISKVFEKSGIKSDFSFANEEGVRRCVAGLAADFDGKGYYLTNYLVSILTNYQKRQRLNQRFKDRTFRSTIKFSNRDIVFTTDGYSWPLEFEIDCYHQEDNEDDNIAPLDRIRRIFSLLEASTLYDAKKIWFNNGSTEEASDRDPRFTFTDEQFYKILVPNIPKISVHLDHSAPFLEKFAELENSLVQVYAAILPAGRPIKVIKSARAKFDSKIHTDNIPSYSITFPLSPQGSLQRDIDDILGLKGRT